jgi:hypothetical protein
LPQSGISASVPSAVSRQPNKYRRRNIDMVFVAALRAFHFKAVAHGLVPLFLVTGCICDATLPKRRAGVASGTAKNAKERLSFWLQPNKQFKKQRSFRSFLLVAREGKRP